MSCPGVSAHDEGDGGRKRMDGGGVSRRRRMEEREKKDNGEAGSDGERTTKGGRADVRKYNTYPIAEGQDWQDMHGHWG